MQVQRQVECRLKYWFKYRLNSGLNTRLKGRSILPPETVFLSAGGMSAAKAKDLVDARAKSRLKKYDRFECRFKDRLNASLMQVEILV